MPDTSRRRTAALWIPMAIADSAMSIANGNAAGASPTDCQPAANTAQNDRFDGERQRHNARPDVLGSIALDDPCADGGARKKSGECDARSDRCVGIKLCESNRQQHSIAGHVRGKYAVQAEITERIDVARSKRKRQQERVSCSG